MSLLKAEVGGVPEFAAGEFGSIEAHHLESKAHAHGLKVRMEDASFTSYLPVNIHGGALIIEYNELASLATEEMRRRGVPVITRESRR